MNSIFFVTGIDTDVGKTVATAWYAQKFTRQGFRTITQKFIQTGCKAFSEDILKHRAIQGIALTEEDKTGLTCPYLLDYPCSPHLAAQLAGIEIDEKRIEQATHTLSLRYDRVLLEGAGGLYVPYKGMKTTLDYIAEHDYPIILVTSGKLGSINHTLLSLQACKQQDIKIYSVVYNQYPETDALIQKDTQLFLETYLHHHFPDTLFELLPQIPI